MSCRICGDDDLGHCADHGHPNECCDCADFLVYNPEETETPHKPLKMPDYKWQACLRFHEARRAPKLEGRGEYGL